MYPTISIRKILPLTVNWPRPEATQFWLSHQAKWHTHTHTQTHQVPCAIQNIICKLGIRRPYRSGLGGHQQSVTHRPPSSSELEIMYKWMNVFMTKYKHELITDLTYHRTTNNSKFTLNKLTSEIPSRHPACLRICLIKLFWNRTLISCACMRPVGGSYSGFAAIVRPQRAITINIYIYCICISEKQLLWILLTLCEEINK